MPGFPASREEWERQQAMSVFHFIDGPSVGSWGQNSYAMRAHDPESARRQLAHIGYPIVEDEARYREFSPWHSPCVGMVDRVKYPGEQW